MSNLRNRDIRYSLRPDGESLKDYSYDDLRRVIQDELEPIIKRQNELTALYQSIERKVTQWETGAFIFRWLVITTAALLTAAAGVIDWLRDHLK